MNDYQNKTIVGRRFRFDRLVNDEEFSINANDLVTLYVRLTRQRKKQLSSKTKHKEYENEHEHKQYTQFKTMEVLT